jgi:Amt family ammonium transporter
MDFGAGNTGFMLVATALVLIMTPGLAFFYGGLVGKKNVVAVMMHSFVSLAFSSVLWYVVGFSLSFSGGEGGVIGNLDAVFLNGVTLTDAWSGAGSIPVGLFFIYQMMFAVITPALITGAFTNRIRFGPYLMFLGLWQLLVYYPFAHMIWGGGLLADWGVLDFAGGIVVHATAGMAALGAVLYLGSRRIKERTPHNIPFVALGTALLWFGWFGFNAGSQLAVDEITMVAFINTHLAASFAALTWMVFEWRRDGNPKLVGLLTGAVAGLATITPAAGFVSPGSAAIMGVAAGVICYGAVLIKEKRGWDDALDVWAVHGIGGIIGTIMLGMFASLAVNPAGADGLFNGGGGFFGKQVTAVLGAGVYALVITYVMLVVINRISTVKTTQADEEAGVDQALHGEIAYLD